jgi:hypothetical protein
VELLIGGAIRVLVRRDELTIDGEKRTVEEFVFISTGDGDGNSTDIAGDSFRVRVRLGSASRRGSTLGVGDARVILPCFSCVRDGLS